MDEDRYELPGGWVIRTVDVDLFGRITTMEVVGTPYWVVRTPSGWRGQIQPTGRQRRRYVTRGTESAGQAVRLLVRQGMLHINPMV